MTNELVVAYLAGIVDGEGYIGIKKTKAYQCQGRATPGYHARIGVRMVDEGAIALLAEVLGGWYYLERQPVDNRRALYCYQVTDAAAAIAIATLRPHLRIKGRQADAVLALRSLQSNRREHMTKQVGTRTFPHSRTGRDVTVRTMCLSDEYVAECDELYRLCKELNHGA